MAGTSQDLGAVTVGFIAWHDGEGGPWTLVAS
jgi:hypothetical protein